MGARQFDFALAIGGAAGQGIATPGDILARIFVRRGLHLNTYNAYQSIIRGGHIFLTVRVSDQEVLTHGDRWDLLLCLDQSTMDRHLRHMQSGSKVIFNADTIEPEAAAEGVALCPIPVSELTGNSRNAVMQNTVALGVIVALLRMDFKVLETAMQLQFGRKGQALVDENVTFSRAGFDYATEHFDPFVLDVPTGPKPLAVWSGNDALAMGGAAAGVKFYSAYPMSPASGILHWMANNAQQLGIMVRQLEDEIAVANVTVGAAHAGCRAMCATSGGGFALMTEAVGMAGMMEVPAVFINVQRAGPSTGVPTKTEQGDLWQALGASQGDYERLIVTPLHALDAFNTMPELFNLVDKCQCPAIVISDLLIAEGRSSVDPDALNMHPEIDRGALITEPAASNGYLRYQDTESGISPRALPGLEGYVHVVASDEHDEDGVLISDEFTNPHKRRKMVEKRARKLQDIVSRIAPPALEGPTDAEITLVGWGSTYGVIHEAVKMLNDRGITVNHLPIKWIVPFHASAVTDVLSRANCTIIVENNYSGQFARYLRSETGISADAHIRKYDGEPFMPHHVVDGVIELMGKTTDRYVPFQEILV
jgi:2-oxoglutarate ferredoxin oxidoreductase subunit alpha